MIWILLIAAIVVLDQATKILVLNNIDFANSIKVIDGFFYLTHITNSGAAWSIFQGGRIYFIILTVIAVAVMGYVMVRNKNMLLRFSLTFLIGGALGNLYDRIFRVSVVDFFEFHFGSYTFPIFNVADCFVVIGTILLAIFLLFFYKEEKKISGE